MYVPLRLYSSKVLVAQYVYALISIPHTTYSATIRHTRTSIVSAFVKLQQLRVCNISSQRNYPERYSQSVSITYRMILDNTIKFV